MSYWLYWPKRKGGKVLITKGPASLTEAQRKKWRGGMGGYATRHAAEVHARNAGYKA